MAIKQQHVRWACCAIMWRSPGVPPLFRNYNCVMPPFEVRQIASDVLNFDRVEPLGPVELIDGTVSLYGYDVGVCKIVAHLGRFHKRITRDRTLIEPNLTFILWSQGDFKRAFRVATALDAGLFKIRNLLLVAQLLTCNYSKALWAVKHNRQHSFDPVFRSYEQLRMYAEFTRVQGHQLDSVTGTSLEVYLATISNTITTTDVAILLPGKAPQGQLRALDFNVIHGNDELNPRFLTIIETPPISTASITRYPPESDTMHKAGVTLPVKFFDLDMYGQHDFEGGEPQLFHIGGDSCTICRIERPELAPNTLTSDIELYTGPEPLCIPNIQIKPRVRASLFDPRKTRRPNGMVSAKYLWRHVVRTQWYEYDNSPLRQYPRPRRRRATKGTPDEIYDDYMRAKLRPTEANKKYPSSITAAELRMAQKESRKESKSSR